MENALWMVFEEVFLFVKLIFPMYLYDEFNEMRCYLYSDCLRIYLDIPKIFHFFSINFNKSNTKKLFKTNTKII